MLYFFLENIQRLFLYFLWSLAKQLFILKRVQNNIFHSWQINIFHKCKVSISSPMGRLGTYIWVRHYRCED